MKKSIALKICVLLTLSSAILVTTIASSHSESRVLTICSCIAILSAITALLAFLLERKKWNKQH